MWIVLSCAKKNEVYSHLDWCMCGSGACSMCVCMPFHVYPMCIYADMMCRWYVCYVSLMFSPMYFYFMSCHSLGQSSRCYPHWATAHHETTWWFAERYNTMTTQSTVPNKDGMAWPLLLSVVEVVIVALALAMAAMMIIMIFW